MKINKDRYDSAINRLIAELTNAILKRRVLLGFSNVRSFHGLDCFRIAKNAVSNDVVTHAIRIYDQHKDAASFWYVIKCNEKFSNAAIKKNNLNLDDIRNLSEKIRAIRDKTHFHIDKNFVNNPSLVWKTAGIAESELDNCLSNTFNLLAEINFIRTGVLAEIPAYDGSDVAKIMEAFQAIHPESPILV